MLRAHMQERWRQAGLADAKSMPVPYVHTGVAAVTHALRVAVGLESLMAGEREIAGQWNRAVTLARGQGLASSLLNTLQTTVGRTVRKVQRLTQFRHPSRGVLGLALTVAEAAASRSGHTPKAVVAGMGDIGRKTAQLLQANGWQVVRVNRTVTQHPEWRPWPEWLPLAREADVLVVATASGEPTVDLRGHAWTTLVIDLGVPAQVRHDAGQPVQGIDALLRAPATLPPVADTGAAHELVQAGVAEFLVACGKREQAGLLRVAHDAYDRAAYQVLPGLLETELPELEPDRRTKLHATLRDLLREVSREIVQEVATQARRAERR
jgi:glutamyl-tRNA reductase